MQLSGFLLFVTWLFVNQLLTLERHLRHSAAGSIENISPSFLYNRINNLSCFVHQTISNSSSSYNSLDECWYQVKTVCVRTRVHVCVCSPETREKKHKNKPNLYAQNGCMDGWMYVCVVIYSHVIEPSFFFPLSFCPCTYVHIVGRVCVYVCVVLCQRWADFLSVLGTARQRSLVPLTALS